MIVAPETCPDCGGRVVPLGFPGRTRRGRGGARVEIPADLQIPTCSGCGVEWMDDATASRLAALDG